LNDTGITVSGGGSVTWTLNASVLPGTVGDSITNAVSATGPGGTINASDTDVIVLFRASFENGDDGTNGVTDNRP
jgi:hypothetical protein